MNRSFCRRCVFIQLFHLDDGPRHGDDIGEPVEDEGLREHDLATDSVQLRGAVGTRQIEVTVGGLRNRATRLLSVAISVAKEERILAALDHDGLDTLRVLRNGLFGHADGDRRVGSAVNLRAPLTVLAHEGLTRRRHTDVVVLVPATRLNI